MYEALALWNHDQNYARDGSIAHQVQYAISITPLTVEYLMNIGKHILTMYFIFQF